jgi:hypothetical protein
MIEVLEYIGNPESRKILEVLGQGAAGSRVTREAKAALARLQGRG